MCVYDLLLLYPICQTQCRLQQYRRYGSLCTGQVSEEQQHIVPPHHLGQQYTTPHMQGKPATIVIVMLNLATRKVQFVNWRANEHSQG